MPMDRSLYPSDWEAIALRIKNEVDWACEKCGRVCRRTGESLPDFIERIEGQNTQWLDWVNQTAIATLYEHPQQYTLTVAHLNHEPRDCDRSNLRALCAPCHCRYDLSQMGTKVMLKREREGQLNLLDPVDQLGLEPLPGGNGRSLERTQLHLGDIGRVVK